MKIDQLIVIFLLLSHPVYEVAESGAMYAELDHCVENLEGLTGIGDVSKRGAFRHSDKDSQIVVSNFHKLVCLKDSGLARWIVLRPFAFSRKIFEIVGRTAF